MVADGDLRVMARDADIIHEDGSVVRPAEHVLAVNQCDLALALKVVDSFRKSRDRKSVV